MSSHGSRKYQQNWPSYDGKEGKLLGEIWTEVVGSTPRLNGCSLGDLVEAEVGRQTVGLAREQLRAYRNATYVYRNRSGHERELPKVLEPLAVLVVAKLNTTPRPEGNRLYLNS